MKYKNAKIYYQGAFREGSFEVREGRFSRIELAGGPGWEIQRDTGQSGRFRNKDDAELAGGPGLEDAVDLQGDLVIPGLIDLHNHGNSGYDFSTCDLEGLKVMAKYLARNGITSFALASMTMPYEALERAFRNAKALAELQDEAARKSSSEKEIEKETGKKEFPEKEEPEPFGMSRIVGINMEGPYFSHGKRGAQNPQYLRAPDPEEFRKLYQQSGGLIRILDVAPELEGAMELIRQASSRVTVSVAHTQADYGTVIRAFEQGATQMTHLFNGMNGIHHRAPGPVAAAFDTSGVFVELICDGVHVDPAVIRIVFALFPGRVILISDALACCGMPDGTFLLGDQMVTLKDRRATLPDGTLAGSAHNLFQMLQCAVSFGIPMEEAILSATINPARQLGLDSEIGSIEEGKKADFLICTESLQLKSVYLAGNRIS
ncbi:MAG: N-acetylglucosamine-6-phosphate deacetylase [Parasporobacterium sp.]|nr:N-acetylglucosamine-6-phosphate deacetylase [Parasporobacterium sp.]